MGSPPKSVLAFLRSMAFAAASAFSGRKVTSALSFGLWRSICAMNARVTSTADTLRARSRRASCTAGAKQGSITSRKDSSHQDDVELLLGVARLYLHRDRPPDEAGQHFDRRRLLLEEAVDHLLRGEDAELARLAEGARLAQD